MEYRVSEELTKRMDALEKSFAALAKRVLGDTVTDVPCAELYKRMAGETVSTGGYISGIEHKTTQKGKPWQSFKLSDRNGKGVFARHFAEFPDWAAQGVACVIDEMSVETWNGKNTYTVRKWRPYQAAAQAAPRPIEYKDTWARPVDSTIQTHAEVPWEDDIKF